MNHVGINTNRLVITLYPTTLRKMGICSRKAPAMVRGSLGFMKGSGFWRGLARCAHHWRERARCGHA